MTNRQKKSLILKIQRQAEKARACYQKKDDLLNDLLPHLPIGEVVETQCGHFQIIDNFAEKNVGYRASSFHRFELKEVKIAKASSRSAKKAGLTSISAAQASTENAPASISGPAISPSSTSTDLETDSVAVAA